MKKGDHIGDYKILGRLGGGGNADVYKASCKRSSEEFAIKVLREEKNKKKEQKKRKRFCSEVKIMSKYQEKIEGILPIIDYSMSDESGYWYVMPIAITLEDEIKEKNLDNSAKVRKIVVLTLELATYLEQFHRYNIYHRDIKPSNIYYYKGKHCFGDFGLVDYPEKENVTKSKESIGAKATIAPEMKWHAKEAQGEKADVYSLAKTLWMLLTNKIHAFEGTYDRDSLLVGLKYFFPHNHLVELDDLLIKSTKEDPRDRPDIDEFLISLGKYLVISEDYKKYNLSQWSYIQRQLFPMTYPDRTSWSNIDDIITVLKLISELPSLNHMFFPNHGGSDLRKVEKAPEKEFIYLYTDANTVNLVKPKMLYYESFGKDYIWNYFRLELDDISPVLSENTNIQEEYLTEIPPAKYVDWKAGNYGFYGDGSPLSKDAKLVHRFIKGSFVFFSKKSFYNAIPQTYDGRHNLVSSLLFRNYINYLRDGLFKISKLENNYNDSKSLISKKFIDFPFRNIDNFSRNLNTDVILNKVIKEVEETAVQEMPRKKGYEQEKKDFRIEEMNFYECINYEKVDVENKLEYYVKWETFSQFNSGKDLYLNKNGKFTEYDNDKTLEIKLRKNALSTFYKCCEIGPKENYDLLTPYFTIEIKRIRKPAHLFKKQEIKKTLLSGDDSHHNTLVINEDGVPMLLDPYESDISFYPVQFETFLAYNNYVGKFSNLEHLQDTYLTCLQGWLIHLEYNQFVYLDYKTCMEEEELIKRIKSYY
ncbi:hypothetical protein TEHD86_1706 [Tetragenococcus halophilus subsp. halophilus]|uniref:protein kinase domain-containing protein n=1 Tax=Tetragenococcus halophilus TaxID=51669 RepID=UPI000CCA7BE2|nr:protein kinase [Tetragenococcus halophilus]GBD82984.1 hypothetical protein TEHD86_1706 [Tetragenococcus halophilus subsp. halophilus]